MPDSTAEQKAFTAIVGVGNIGSTLARLLVGSGEPVLLASTDGAHAKALAEELGPLARAASVDDAITQAETVVLALWLDKIKEVIPPRARLFEGKVVVDPSNPVAFDANGQAVRTLPEEQSAGSVVAALLPQGAHYVKAFGSVAATDLARGAHRQPRRAVLFYASDDDVATNTIERLIRAAGFEPLRAGGVADIGRIEGPSGDLNEFGLNGQLVDLDQAQDALA
jgi:8-hydroxy-5-deazaflavin:NADPH oxidoreductase